MVIAKLSTKEKLVGAGLVLSLVITIVFTFNTMRGWEFEFLVDPSEGVAAVLDAPISSPSPRPVIPATTTPLPTAEDTSVPMLPTPKATEMIPVSGFFDAALKEVIHIENGKMTMVKIKATVDLEGSFYAELATSSSTWEYACTIYQYNQKYLFCFGGKLPDREQAIIFIFQDSDQDGEAVLVFVTDLLVPVLLKPSK